MRAAVTVEVQRVGPLSGPRSDQLTDLREWLALDPSHSKTTGRPLGTTGLNRAALRLSPSRLRRAASSAVAATQER